MTAARSRTLLSAYRVGARVAWRRAAAGARAPASAPTPLPRWPSPCSRSSTSSRAARPRATPSSSRPRPAPRRPAARPGAAHGLPPPGRSPPRWSRPLARRLAATRRCWPRWSGAAPPSRRPRRTPPLDTISARLAGDRSCALVPDPGAPGRLGRALPGSRRPRGGPRARGALGRGGARADARPPRARPRRGGPAARRGSHSSPTAICPSSCSCATAGRSASCLPWRSRPWRAAPRAPASGSPRRCGAGSTTRAGCPTSRPTSTCIPQTVRYRVSQLREAFGAALDDPEERLALSIAVRAPRAGD